MAAYTESAPSITSKGSKYSVYQTEGKPLSTEAIYRAKMKYGIYNNPARVSLGVDPSASDTAALLAANTDLTVKQYSRELSADAATAALYAKGEPPVAWKRTNIAPEAEYAAISAKSPLNIYPSQTPIETDSAESNGAAAAALKKSAKSALQEQYDFDEVRSGKVTISQLNNGSKSLKSLSGSRDYRSGISTSNRATEGSRKINISGITDAAKKSAERTLTSRMTPPPSSRTGIITSSFAEETNTKSSSIYIKDIYNQSQNASKRAISTRTATIRTYGIQTPSDEGLVVNPAAFAAGALKTDPSVDFAELERSTLKDNSLVNQNLYSYALKNAETTISKLRDEAAEKSIYSNQKFNEKAYEIAYANSQKRKAAMEKGNIQLGGGLSMPASEINKLAESLVAPAILDLNDKIGKMKDFDAERGKLPSQMRQREGELKAEQRAKEVALQKKRADESAARRDQLKLDKASLIEEHIQMKEALNAEYQEAEEAYTERSKEYQSNKDAIDEERAEKKRVIDETKAQKDEERATELEELVKSHDDGIAPLLSELEVEHGKLDDLVKIREEKEAFFNEQKARIEKSQGEIDEYLRKLEALKERSEGLESDINEIGGNLDLETGLLTSSEGQLLGLGQQKETELPKLENELKELHEERERLHTAIAEKRTEVNDLALEHHEESKKVNEIYPEHLRSELGDHVPVHDDDLADDKFPLDTKPLDIPAEIESEPEVEKESIWPEGFDPEPKKVVEEPEVEEPETEVEDLAKGDKEKTEEVVDGDKAIKAEAKNDIAKTTTGVSSKVKVPVIKSDKSTKRGFFSIFGSKKGKKTSSEGDYVLKSKPKSQTEAQKKFKGLQEDSSEAKDSQSKAVEKPVQEAKVAGTTKEVDDDVFSGFSQGS